MAGVEARVRFWSDEDGWGVVDAPETPGGCWVHFSSIATAGYRTLTGVPSVQLEWERARQDGFDYRAVRVWPVDTDPESAEPPGRAASGFGNGAYRSTLTLEFDDGRTITLSGDGRWIAPGDDVDR